MSLVEGCAEPTFGLLHYRRRLDNFIHSGDVIPLHSVSNGKMFVSFSFSHKVVVL